jgi:tripartite-type tricarboxylate transporter receptor subunit TctC
MRNPGMSFALLACLLLGLPSSGAASEVDFSGKTLTVLVGYSAGGPVDNFARLIATQLRRHLPGSPNLVVQNKPGAGGVLAANYLYTVAKKDGSIFLVTIAPFTNEFIGARHVRFHTDKFYWLSALNYSNTIYVRSDLGVASAADLLTVKARLVLGGLRPNSSRDLWMMTFLEAIGRKDYKYVAGYQGTREIRNALARGEVNFSTESVVALATDMAADVKQGNIVPLVQSGLTKDNKMVPDPRLPKVPVAGDFVPLLNRNAEKSIEYRAMNLVISMFALGRAVFAPPGIDHAAGETLRMAFTKMAADPEFQQRAAKMNGGENMDVTDGAEAQKFAENIARLVKAHPDALAYLNALSKEK